MPLLSPDLLEIAPLGASPLPIGLALVKDHLAVDGDEFRRADRDLHHGRDPLGGNIHATHHFARSHSWVLRDFPRHRELRVWLPRGKTQSVESIVYVNGGQNVALSGPSSAAPGTDFAEDLRGDNGGLVLPPSGASWPAADRDAASPVVINFAAGWLADMLPRDVLHGILFAVSDAFDNRGTADLSQGRNFSTHDALLSPYRLHRFY